MKVAGALAASVLGGAAMAQALPDVTVQGSRAVKAEVDHTDPWILKVSLSYDVSTAGLDLATPAGAKEFEKRVNDAALAVCKELGKQYPNSWPNDEGCAKAATHEAMGKVHKLEAAAAKGK
jgi:UrcA family protein